MSTTFILIAAAVAVYLVIGSMHWKLMQVWDHLNGGSNDIARGVDAGIWQAVAIKWTFIVAWPIYIAYGKVRNYLDDRRALAR